MPTARQPISLRIINHFRRQSLRRFHRAAIRLAADPEDRAIMLLAEGAELLSITRFSAGNPLRSITIRPDDELGGYHISEEGAHDDL